MKERPILFSAPMVRAIIEGRKTMTRRIVKGTALEWLAPNMFTPEFVANPENYLCPYGRPGDRLWVRETFAYGLSTKSGLAYRATSKWDDFEDGTPQDLEKIKWRPSIFMPRWASRITLEVTAVRVERLQQISVEDARAEGMTGTHTLGDFRELWDSINAKRGYSWESNPWVLVIEFKRIEATA